MPPLTITQGNVDLEISSVISAEYEDRQLTTRFNIRNFGSDAVGRYEVKLEIIDPSGNLPPIDTYYPYEFETDLEYAYDDIVFGNSVEEISVEAEIGRPLDPGVYYVRFTLNPSCEIIETNCANNSFIAEAFPIIVGTPTVSHLRLNGLTPDTFVSDTDRKMTVGLNFTNTGTTTGFEQSYTATITDDKSNTKHTQEFALPIDFAPGTTADRAVELNLSAPLPVGTNYTVSLTCGADCHTFSLPSTATFTVVSTEYLLTGTVRGDDGVTINKGQLFLYQDNGSGNVGIVQTVPYQGPTFSFTIDGNKSQTLYFVPDPVLYPGYVPTIYGKSVTLQSENFFRAQEDMNITLEVIKMQPKGTGTGIINGYVRADDAAAKTASPLASVEGTAVVLISSSNKVVGVAYTDASGFYEFKELPRDSYQVVLRQKLDQAQMLPYAIDITEKNIRLDLNTLPTGIEPIPSQLFLSQHISFSDLGSRPYGSARISLDAKSDQALPVKYKTSDADVATVENNEIVIHNAGIAVITSSQDGNAFYLPATATQTLVVTQVSQLISFDSFKAKSVDVGSISLSANASSGLDISFESSDVAVVSIEEQTAVIHKPGEVTITARQVGNRNYLAADAVARKLVTYNVLGIEPLDHAKYAHPNPTSDLVFLEIPQWGQVAVFDALGKERHDVTRVDNTLDFSQAEAGVYMVRISVDNRSAMTRIVKK